MGGPRRRSPVADRIGEDRTYPSLPIGEPIPGLGAYYHQMVVASADAPDHEQLAGLRRQLAARAVHDVVADLPSIARPTLVCAGRYDDIAPIENSQLLADRIADARLQVFEGGHTS